MYFIKSKKWLSPETGCVGDHFGLKLNKVGKETHNFFTLMGILNAL